MSASEPRELVYGNTVIPFALSYAVRKTISVTVHPDLRVTVVAPEGAALADIEALLRRRARWIVARRRQFERYAPDLPPGQYVSGETHRYLGRQVRLKVELGEPEGITLGRSYLTVRVPDRADTAHVRALVEAWYLERARAVFAERLALCYPRVAHLGAPYPPLSVRAMTTRWGSTSRAGRITLNLKLIQVPVAYIDYVVCHELCHLIEPHHGRTFYELLGRVLPGWEAWRERLNEYEFG